MHSSPASGYIGRFAPSPTGPLHFGSLVAAVASYLDARAHHGRWLVRIEDVDRQRRVEGADTAILQCLQAHGLFWDGTVLRQSQRDDYYRSMIAELRNREWVYHCICTRKMIRQAGGIYPGTCRLANHPPQNAAVRVKLNDPITRFEDRIQGPQHIQDPHALEDMVLQRRDGLYAYNLAVVADDIAQGVTHIVRGTDLLPTTAAHLSLYQSFKAPAPKYAHLPVAATEPGFKLSKQNKAAALDNQNAKANLIQALKFLHLGVPDTLHGTSCDKILNWAVDHFCCESLPGTQEIMVDKHQSTFYTD